jgi:thiamine biosynthesis protein ThiS
MGNEAVSFRDTVFFMQLIVNGEPFETPHTETIADLLRELGIEPGRIAIEVNLSIIKKSAYHTFKLHDGDKIEIVNFVGGG